MLQIFRNKAQSIFIQIIVVVIALVFIFWGVGTNMMNKGDAALVVNGEEISFQQFQKAYEEASQRLSDQFGGSVPKGMAESLGLKDQVVNRLVQEELLRQGGQQMGVELSELEIQHAIQAMPAFQKDGAFDHATYKEVLAANRLSPSSFEESMRLDMGSQKTVDAISKFSAQPTSFEIADAYSQSHEEVSVQYASFLPASYLKDIKVEPKTLAAWFTKHAQQYQKGDKIKLTYLSFDFATIAQKVQVTPEEAKSYYQKNSSLFKVPEKRDARHILFIVSPGDSQEKQQQQLAKAQKVLKRAEAGEDFATLAREFSEGPSKKDGGELGFFSKDEMIAPFSKAAFALKKGGISGIVKTNFGYHIIKCEDIQAATVTPFNQVESEISKTLQNKQAKALAFQLANDAYEGIISAGSLQKYVTGANDAPVTTTDYFSRDDAPAAIANNTVFLDTAFALQKNELSSLLTTDSGYDIIYVDNIEKAKIPQLDEVRDQVVADYKNILADEKAKEKAEALLAALNEKNADFVKLAKAAGTTVSQSSYLSRQKPSTGFPQELVNQIFSLSPKVALPEHAQKAQGAYYVFQYLDRKLPNKELSESEQERYSNAMAQSKQQMLLSAWLAHQQESATIERSKNL